MLVLLFNMHKTHTKQIFKAGYRLITEKRHGAKSIHLCMFFLVHSIPRIDIVIIITAFRQLMFWIFLCEHWGAILTVAIATRHHQQQTAGLLK